IERRYNDFDHICGGHLQHDTRPAFTPSLQTTKWFSLGCPERLKPRWPGQEYLDHPEQAPPMTKGRAWDIVADLLVQFEHSTNPNQFEELDIDPTNLPCRYLPYKVVKALREGYRRYRDRIKDVVEHPEIDRALERYCIFRSRGRRANSPIVAERED